MPFPKQQQGAKAPKGGEPTGASDCYFCKQQVDLEDPHGYILGTCSKCGPRPFCFQCVADYLEKNVRVLNSNSKAMEKGRNIARNRPQDLFAQNRTVQRKPQPCPDSACSGLMVNAELVKPQKPPPQQQAAEEEDAPAPGKQSPPKQQAPKAQPAKAQPKAPAAAPAIKRLVSAPTITRIASGSSGAVGGEEASRSGTATPATLSRAASTSGEGASRPASSLSTGPAAAAAAARRQLEQQREAAAALKSDIAAAGRCGAAAARASSSAASGSSSAAGGWGKVTRSISAPITPAKQEPAEDWPALGPGGTQKSVGQQPAQPQPSAASYASLLDVPPRPDAEASRPAAAQPAAEVEAAAELSAGRAAPPPATPSLPAAAQPSLQLVGSETSRAGHDTFSDDDEDGADFAGSIAAALRKQQQALLQQLASGQQPWEQAQPAAQPAAQQQGSAQPPMPEPLQQLTDALQQHPATQPWYEAAAPAEQPGLLPLPPHLSSQPQTWEQHTAAEPAYGWEQQQDPSALWQQAPAGYDDGYAAGLAAAAALMQQPRGGMGGQAQPYEQAAQPYKHAYVPPPQARPEGDEAEVDALLSLLGIG